MRRPHEMKGCGSSQAPRIFGRPDLDTNKQIKTSQTSSSRVQVVSVVTMYLPEDGLLYATAVPFLLNLFVVLVALTGGRSLI
jgi:positive regulator of sigma E activity